MPSAMQPITLNRRSIGPGHPPYVIAGFECLLIELAETKTPMLPQLALYPDWWRCTY